MGGRIRGRREATQGDRKGIFQRAEAEGETGARRRLLEIHGQPADRAFAIHRDPVVGQHLVFVREIG